tara:strand:+ start:152 stop:1102 length:951 start_codon:yes stop_codon:yes gene_type:complete
MLLDCFNYCDNYGKELLLLRYHILKKYVDKFIIVEADKSHTGNPNSYKCKQRIAEWGLPPDHFEVIELQMPEDDDLIFDEVDISNLTDFKTGESNRRLSSLKCRLRERFQRNAFVEVLKKYTSDALVIFGDLDEILNPHYLEKCNNVIFQSPENNILYTRLIFLQGQGNLQVFKRQPYVPTFWEGQFLVANTFFQKTDPTKIRCGKMLPDNIRSYFLTDENGLPFDEMGWHFSWMGDAEDKVKKVKSWGESFDKFSWHIYKSYSSPDYLKFLSKEFKHGDPSPCGFNNYILNEIGAEKLPKQIFEIPEVENYLFSY